MEVPRHWRLQGQRYGLTGTVCSKCGKPFFAPRPVCDVCNAPTIEMYTFGRKHVGREQAQVQEPAQR